MRRVATTIARPAAITVTEAHRVTAETPGGSNARTGARPRAPTIQIARQPGSPGLLRCDVVRAVIDPPWIETMMEWLVSRAIIGMRTGAMVLGLGAVLLAGCGVTDEGAAKKAVEADLNDPASAQYRAIHSYRLSDLEELRPTGFTPGGRIVCGEVNAKNRFGGYVGFKRFMYDVSSANLVNEPVDIPGAGPIEVAGAGYEKVAFDLNWSMNCRAR